MQKKIQEYLVESIAVKTALTKDSTTILSIEKAAQKIVAAYRSGGKVLLAGNGGSAADAQHVAGELVARFCMKRIGLPAIALTTDTSVLTAIGNDYDFATIFARQVQALGVQGDVFVGISTSGNSENIVRALTASKEKCITTIGLTGSSGGRMAELCDILIAVPSAKTPHIQESHLAIEHILCYLIENELFSTN